MFMVVFLIERDRQGRPERVVRDHRAAATAFFRDAVRSWADIVADLRKVAGPGGWPRLKAEGEDAFRREVWVEARG
jgi:hypothetical protein